MGGYRMCIDFRVSIIFVCYMYIYIYYKYGMKDIVNIFIKLNLLCVYSISYLLWSFLND